MGQKLGRVQLAVLALEILKHSTQRKKREKEGSGQKKIRGRSEESLESMCQKPVM